MMRVLALVTDAYGARGGIARVARDVIGVLAASERFAAVEILPRQAPDSAAIPPAGAVQHRAVPGKLAYAARALLAALGARGGLIYCNHVNLAPLGALIARLTGARLIVQLHGIEVWSRPRRSHRRALEAADLLLCVSRDTRARVLGWIDIAPERAVVVCNTVGEEFTPGDRASARARFGLTHEFALLSVGRLDASERYKGHSEVIAALAGLKGAGERELLYLIAGDGDDRARLERLAAEAGLSARVRFLGQVAESDLADLYRAADLFVLPSRGEGFGIVFLEAMACGTPAMGLGAGGARDALADGELGTLVAPDGDLAAALAGLVVAAPPEREALAERVRQRFGRPLFEARIARAVESLHWAAA